jgi:hypothetical protein
MSITSLQSHFLIVNIFNDGGPIMMSLILICLLIALFFLVRGFLNVKKNPMLAHKMRELASDASLLGLVLGFLGSILGMISAFDSIEMLGDISTGMMASGLKVSFLTVLFGAFVFLLSRVGILILRAMLKPKSELEVKV